MHVLMGAQRFVLYGGVPTPDGAVSPGAEVVASSSWLTGRLEVWGLGGGGDEAAPVEEPASGAADAVDAGRRLAAKAKGVGGGRGDGGGEGFMGNATDTTSATPKGPGTKLLETLLTTAACLAALIFIRQVCVVGMVCLCPPPRSTATATFRTFPAALAFPEFELLVFTIFTTALTHYAASTLFTPSESAAMRAVGGLILVGIFVVFAVETRRLLHYHAKYGKERWEEAGRVETVSQIRDPAFRATAKGRVAAPTATPPAFPPRLTGGYGELEITEALEPARTARLLETSAASKVLAVLRCSGTRVAPTVATGGEGGDASATATPADILSALSRESLASWLNGGRGMTAISSAYMLLCLFVQVLIAVATGVDQAENTMSVHVGLLCVLAALQISTSLFFTRTLPGEDRLEVLCVAASLMLEASAVILAVVAQLVSDAGAAQALVLSSFWVTVLAVSLPITLSLYDAVVSMIKARSLKGEGGYMACIIDLPCAVGPALASFYGFENVVQVGVDSVLIAKDSAFTAMDSAKDSALTAMDSAKDSAYRHGQRQGLDAPRHGHRARVAIA